MQLGPEAFELLMKMDAPQEQKLALFRALEREWQAYQRPSGASGVNEETERLRNVSTYAERKRAKDRARRAAEREELRRLKGEATASSATTPATTGEATAPRGDQPATTGDAEAQPSRTRVVIPSLPHLRSEEVGVGGAVTREPDPKPDDWPEGNGPHLAKLLVEAAGSHWLDPNRSPELTLTAGRLAAWKRDGASWEHDVVPVVVGLCAKRRSRIASWKYFDEAIARSIAENRAALAIPEASQVIPLRATGPPRTVDEKNSAMWEATLRKFEDDEQPKN